MKKTCFVVAGLVLLFIAGNVLADWCNGRSRPLYYDHQQAHSDYYQHTPYVDYRYPGWYFYNGKWYYNQNYDKIILIPKAIEVETRRSHYYSIDDYYKQQLFLDALEARLKRIGVTNVKPEDVARPAPEVEKQPKPASGVPQAKQAGTFQSPKLIVSINNSCLKCHGATDSEGKVVLRGGLSMLTPDGKLPDFSNEYVWKIFGKVATGEMPKTGNKVSEEDSKLYYEWVKATER
jgi:hypothetical protein